MIGWSNYRLGLPSAPLRYGLTWPVGIPTVFHTPMTVLCTALTAGKCLPLGLCNGTVEDSRWENNREENIVWFNSLWPSDDIWQRRSGPTLVRVMACCLAAPSYYLNQCWLIISEVPWHSSEGINYLKKMWRYQSIKQNYIKVATSSPSGPWVNFRRAEFISGNIKMHLHFVSFLNTGEV